MSSYTGVYSLKETRQDQSIPGRDQVENTAGGFVFAIDDWARLDRWLILGADGPTYYQSGPKLARENAECVVRCLDADGPRAVARIADISHTGRAPKNSPAIFALALAAALGDGATKAAAFAALPKVCRIGTHLFEFAEYVHGLRGWGRGLRSAIADWYGALPASKLAYQVVKYQSRNGWSNRDLLRLAHAKPTDERQEIVYHWIVKGWPGVGDEPHPMADVQLIWAFEKAKRATSEAEVVRLIADYRLPREAVPTQFLANPTVWAALLDDTPMTAMLRNLATMSKVGLLVAGSDAERLVIAALRDVERIRRARVHPIAILSALKVYAQGHGERSKGIWTPCAKVVDSLDESFYASFQTIEPTGRRHLIGLDVSGSMGTGQIAGVPGLTPSVASAALALVTLNVEPECEVIGFTDGGFTSGDGRSRYAAYQAGVTPLSISPRQRLDDVLTYIGKLSFGGTDCALPMLYAQANGRNVDLFEILTDNETWAGEIHPSQALRRYREATGIAAKCAVVGMTATKSSIADPDDAGMLDVVGFDSATPALIADFARG